MAKTPSIPPRDAGTVTRTALGRVWVSDYKPIDSWEQKVVDVVLAPVHGVIGLFSPTYKMKREAARQPEFAYLDARDLKDNPAGYIRPSEVETVIRDGKEVERVKSAVTVSQAYQGVVDKAEAAAKVGRGVKALKIAGGIAAAGAALAGLNWLSKRGKTTQNQDIAVDIVAPAPQAAFVDVAADEKPGNYWQSTVRGNGPQNAASIPKMNVVPADMVQDLGAAPMVRK